jgi:ParB family chromosome partitioning protein
VNTSREIRPVNTIARRNTEVKAPQVLGAIIFVKGYNRLIEEFSLTQEEIATRIGKSRPAVANILRLLNLDEKVKNYVMDGVLTEGHARALIAVQSSDLQYEIAKKIIDGGLNVRQTEKLVKSLSNIKKKKPAKKVEQLFITDIQDRLKNTLGTKVNVSYGRKKGKIEIEYYSYDDLERILDILKI